MSKVEKAMKSTSMVYVSLDECVEKNTIIDMAKLKEISGIKTVSGKWDPNN